MRMWIQIAAPAALALTALVAPSIAAPDLRQGERLAKRWCAECHVVASDQTRAKADVPSFANVASRLTSREIAAFLTGNPPRMPDMTLSRDEIGDLVGYIKALAPGPDEPKVPKPEQDDARLPKRG